MAQMHNTWDPHCDQYRVPTSGFLSWLRNHVPVVRKCPICARPDRPWQPDTSYGKPYDGWG